MKRILRHFVIDTYALYIISRIASGMVFEKGTYTLIIAGIGLTVVSLVAKPVINLLLLPLNMITYGLFRWVSSAVVLYLVTLLVKDFKILAFSYPGYFSKWIDIPGVNFQGVLAFVGFSFVLSVITSFIYWLIK